jgi:hypothetical protein
MGKHHVILIKHHVILIALELTAIALPIIALPIIALPPPLPLPLLVNGFSFEAFTLSDHRRLVIAQNEHSIDTRREMLRRYLH